MLSRGGGEFIRRGGGEFIRRGGGEFIREEEENLFTKRGMRIDPRNPARSRSMRIFLACHSC
jgi:hypothetical protein